MRFFFKKTVLAFFSVFFLSFSALSLAIEHSIPNFTAKYILNHNSIEIGRITLSVKALDDQQYQLVSATQTSGLLAFIRDDEVVERSLFELTKKHIRPLAYQYKQTIGDDLKDIRLQFDWQNLTLTNTVKGRDWSMHISEGVLDKALMQVALMLDLQEAEKTLNYQIADGGKLKEYTFTHLGTETITVAGQPYETIKLARKKDDKPLITYYWCATSLHNLPVLLKREKTYGTFEMRLLKVKFTAEKIKP
ncbi:MAG TPA: DUF3108 domain-containing protein [Cycloclasticus sp.]|jgi:hypothetical protein|nr:DUF3108 domain-containing protein [Cycloclasticus sp.]